jgi:hypothetical protein
VALTDRSPLTKQVRHRDIQNSSVVIQAATAMLMSELPSNGLRPERNLENFPA